MGARSSQTALAAAIGLVLIATGCTGSRAGSGLRDVSAVAGITVGVIVSDPETSGRWEEIDEPLLTDAMTAEGLQPDVENSDGDPAMFALLADNMIRDGVKVLIIAAPNSQIGAAVAAQAAARHIPTIDYDYAGVDFGGFSDYAVSFDPLVAGDLQGRGLTQDIRAERVHGVDIIELDGPRTDPTSALLAQGARDILQPRYDSGAYRLVGRGSVEDGQQAGAIFAQFLTANGDHVNGVLAANDTIASAVITVLTKKGLNGKVRVTGLGATPQALQAILRGDQFMTVFPPAAQQATAVAKLAAALAKNDDTTVASMVSMTLTAPVTHHKVRAVLVPPVFITFNTINKVIDSGLVASRDICVGELALRCDQLDIPR